MLHIEIPGRAPMDIANVVFDYNGTIAVDGKVLPELRERIEALLKLVPVYVLTADTYGTVRAQCEPLGMIVHTFPREGAAQCKEEGSSRRERVLWQRLQRYRNVRRGGAVRRDPGGGGPVRLAPAARGRVGAQRGRGAGPSFEGGAPEGDAAELIEASNDKKRVETLVSALFFCL